MVASIYLSIPLRGRQVENSSKLLYIQDTKRLRNREDIPKSTDSLCFSCSHVRILTDSHFSSWHSGYTYCVQQQSRNIAKGALCFQVNAHESQTQSQLPLSRDNP